MAKGTHKSKCNYCNKSFLCGDCVREECHTCHRILKLANRYFDYDKEKVHLWLRSPNPVINDMTPQEFMRMKDPMILINKMIEAKDGNTLDNFGKLKD